MLKNPAETYDLVEYVIAPPMALSLHWKDGKVKELQTRWATSVTESTTLSHDARALKAALQRYVDGQAPHWPTLPLDLDQLTDFHRTVLEKLYTIPAGTMLTYGQLAAEIGKPNGARAIGRAMATNPFPILYPCHRIIGANGKMTGFSAEGGVDMKEYLLKHEGALSE
jgi:methylated-DNA-[protein]-cysteine S-methyltransferase